MSGPAPQHEEWADAVGAYLLEAMPKDERIAYEAHLDACAVCRRDVALLRVASDALPASVQQLVPPPALKDRIMSVVRAEAELLAAAGPSADWPAPAPARRAWGFGSFFAMRPAFVLAAVALLLVVGGITGALVSGGGAGDGRTVVATVDRSQAETATARLVVHDSDSKIEVTNLPVPPEGRVYQVWLKRPGRNPQPTTALFVPRADGSGSVSVPGSLEGVERVLVTDELDGGSSQPTRRPVITVSPA